jgi:hypothetical protein
MTRVEIPSRIERLLERRLAGTFSSEEASELEQLYAAEMERPAEVVELSGGRFLSRSQLVR